MISRENKVIWSIALCAAIAGCSDPPPPRAPAGPPPWQPPPGYGPPMSPAWGPQPPSPFGPQPPAAPIAPAASSPLPPPLVPPIGSAAPANSGIARDPSRPANGTVANAGSVVGSMAADFRRCYNAGLIQDENMQGSVRIDAKVDAKGDVAEATPRDVTGLSAQVVACLVDRVKKATFAPPEGGAATVSIPVTFKTK